MAQQTLNATAGGPDDNLPTATAKLNSMFGELYALQSRTLNAADPRFAGATNEASINNAINMPVIGAVATGASQVFIPASMLPYNASQVTFNAAVRMVREGGNFAVYDLRAYGAAGDAGTDDTAAFFAIVSAIPTGGGTIYVPAGTYMVNPATTINIPVPETTIQMDVSATFLLAANAQLADGGVVFTVTQGADYVTFTNFNFNGNRANQTKRLRALVGFQVRQLRIVDPFIVDCTGYGITIVNCPDAELRHPIVQRCGRTGVAGTCEQGVAILNDQAYNAAFYATGITIFGGRISESGLDGLIVTAPGARINGVTANRNGIDKTDVGAAGIFVGGAAGATGVEIRGCYCYDNSACGIDSGGAGTMVGVHVVDNECFLNGNAGIQVGAAQYPYVEGNRCYNNYQAAAAGVILSAKVLQKGGIAIATYNDVADAYVRRNLCYDTQTPKTQVWGLQIGAAASGTCSNLTVEDNDFRGNLSGAIGTEYGSQPQQFVTSGFSRFARNLGYTPTLTTLTNGGTQLAYVSTLLTITFGGATNCFGISAARYEDECTLKFGNGNATLKAAGGNFVLKGAVDVVPASGTVMRFVFDGTFWREIARNF